MPTQFSYQPPAPEALSGPEFISQAERAINELGVEIDEIHRTADYAVTVAVGAETTANSALSTVQSAVSQVQGAVNAAHAAGEKASLALLASGQATGRANAAYAKAEIASAMAEIAYGLAAAKADTLGDDIFLAPWRLAVVACRESRSAIVQAMDGYRAYARGRKNALDIAENRAGIDQNARYIENLAWTSWGTAIVACRESRSAIVQAMRIYETDTAVRSRAWGAAIVAARESRSAVVQAIRIYATDTAVLSRAWETAITVVRGATSAVRQAVETANLYRLVQALASGGGNGSGMVFVPNN